MFVVTGVTPDNRVTIGIRREQYGETEQANTATLTLQEARAYASQILSRVELAERRVRQATAEKNEPRVSAVRGLHASESGLHKRAL